MAIEINSKKRSGSICMTSDQQAFELVSSKTFHQQLAMKHRDSSSGSDSPEIAYRELAKPKTQRPRQAAHRSKSERLQGAKPRVKRRERNLPLDLACANSGSVGGGLSNAANNNENADSYQTFLRKAPSAGRLLNDSYDTPDGSPRVQRRPAASRPPLPSSVTSAATPDTSPSLARKLTGHSPSNPNITRLTRNSERSPGNNVRSRDGLHRRTGSVRGSGNNASGTPKGDTASRRSAYLDIPDVPGAADDEHQTGHTVDEDSYRLRSFDLTRKGVVNRGDSFRRRRSRSNSLAPHQQQQLQDFVEHKGIRMNNGTSFTNVAATTEADNVQHSQVTKYRVAIVGTHGVGKSALVGQFMTSECINAYNDRTKNDDAESDESVFVMLNGEESELIFSYFANIKAEMNRSELPDAFVVLYSVIDKTSFQRVEDELARLQNWDALRGRALIVVGNKIDLVRSRAVSTQDGKCLACAYRGKFMEISVVINHNVDELLVGILTQIRLKEELQREIAMGTAVAEDAPHGQSSSSWFRNKGLVRASMKAKQIFTWFFGKDDDQYNNCENFQIL